MLRMLEENQDEILNAMKTDLNRNEFEGFVYDIGVVRSDIIELIRNLPSWSTPRCYDRKLITLFSRGYLVPQPYGVTLIIGTWNYPFMLCLMPLAAAICAGNVVVVKPSNISPTCSKLISKLIRQYLDPTSVWCYSLICRIVQVLGSEMKGDRNTTSALLEQKFDYIFFTGNHTVGRVIMEKAAKNLTPVTLELGGKNPVFVTKHADLYLAAKRILCCRTFNGGQQCVSPDYVLVEKDVEEAFYDAVRRVEKECFESAEDQIGHIVDQRHYDTIVDFYENSENSISEVIIGGKNKFKPETLFVPPTVLRMKDLTCPLMTEELFSPILPVYAVDSYNDAIAICNAREKPLSIYIFSDKRSEVEDITFATDSGGVTVNNCL